MKKGLSLGKKAVIVSGSVGTGKTTFAMQLAHKLRGMYLGINELIEEYKLSDGYDRKRKSRIVDVDKLNRLLIEMIQKSKKTLVIDGHLSHFLPKKYVEKCYILKCDLKAGGNPAAGGLNMSGAARQPVTFFCIAKRKLPKKRRPQFAAHSTS